MRLLAYGGTAYVERQRIGTWESVPRDALDDSFRLEEERLTFGLCLIEKDPVLVIRKLQFTKTGRAYAYSLLLDPGMDIWRKFEWDAAALADALFKDQVVRKLLLEQPEELSAQELGGILKTVSEKTDQSIKKHPDEINDHEAAWIGGFFTTSPSSLTPQVIGFPARPDSAETSALIHRLPPCFRAGMGWLVGSSSQSARSFGGRFSIDERAEFESITPFVELGHKLYKALQALAADDDFAETSNQLATKPAWDWFEGATENPTPLADRLVLLADLLTASSVSDELLDQAIAALPQTEFLQTELRRAWQRAVVASKKKLTATQTVFALENFDHSLQLPNDYLGFLDPQQLAERFVNEGFHPSHQGVPQLPVRLRNTVWGLLLQRSQDQDLPRIFFEAIDDIEEMAGDEAPDYVTALTDVVSKRMAKDSTLNLLFWKNHSHNRHWADISETLCDLSLQRARSGNAGWQFEYLLFADDERAEKLLQADLSKSQLRNMILSFVSVVQNQREYAAEARQWLGALADSRVRLLGVLTCDDKYSIGANVNTWKWTRYVDLSDLYVNHTKLPNPRIAPDEEKDILIKELEELIRQKPAIDFVPDVKGLQIMLGHLPDSIMRSFRELSPEISNSANAAKLVDYWRSIDPARAPLEEVRVMLNVEEDLNNNFWLQPEFEEKHLNNILSTLMFGSHPTRNALYQRRFRSVLTQASAAKAKHVHNAVRTIFKDKMQMSGNVKVFCERFREDRVSLELLFQVLPKTTSALVLTDALYEVAQKSFVKEAENAWHKAQEDQTISTYYQRALLYHLYKRPNARIQVERVLEDKIPGKQIKLRLEEILKSDPDPGAFEIQLEEVEPITRATETTQPPVDNDVASHEEEKEGFLSWIKSSLGIGSAREESKVNEGRRGEILPGLSSAKRTSGRQNKRSKDAD